MTRQPFASPPPDRLPVGARYLVRVSSRHTPGTYPVPLTVGAGALPFAGLLPVEHPRLTSRAQRYGAPRKKA
ncbi:hypothetical protein ACFYWU_41130 [Streptomyces chrestomyceticus]|uniref:hypothetical protein n=1 Tax=Streptomyces chrestomyceticus TaxID=68185 RepID=UPI00367ACB1C